MLIALCADDCPGVGQAVRPGCWVNGPPAALGLLLGKRFLAKTSTALSAFAFVLLQAALSLHRFLIALFCSLN